MGQEVRKTQSELDAILPELKTAIRDYVCYLWAVGIETIPEAFGTTEQNGSLDCQVGSG
jgi:hypothetical protein